MKKKILMLVIATVTAICCLIGLSACGGNARILNFQLNYDGNSYRVTDANNKITHIKIPSTYKNKPVTAIGNQAFVNCTALREVTISEGITSIGHYSFQYCTGLGSISFPSSLTDIDEFAFFCCGIAGELIIPATVVNLGRGAFYGCNKLTGVIIENGLTEINRDVFSECESLTSITIPVSVKSIYENAFSECSRLSSIVYKGTKSQWEQVDKDDYWDFLTGTYTVHCTDGDISK